MIKFEYPELEIEKFAISDVITTSCPDDCEDYCDGYSCPFHIY